MMSNMMANPDLLAAAEEVAYAFGHGRNPYFAALADGRMTRADFLAGQHRFLSAVEYFSRPMLVLASRLDDPAARAAILANAWEEHGEGDPGRHHGTTFRELLRRLGAAPEEIGSLAPWGCVEAFNAAIMDACRDEPPAMALAGLGMIEWMFADISIWIGRSIVERGWLSAAELIHYDLHADIDRGHADGFWAAIDWPRAETEARRGLAFGACVFNDLYLGLLDEQAGQKAVA